MKEKLNIEEIKQKLFDKLEPSGWGQKLKPFIFSGDFDNILIELIKLSEKGKNFTPTLKNLFRAFEECPYDKLKVVIIGQEPYVNMGTADGIAFSCGNDSRIETSLKFMLTEINSSVYGDYNISIDPDLKRWSNQGILLFNSALTSQIGKSGQHYELWKPFMAYLFDLLNHNENKLIYLYIGKHAQKWIDSIDDVKNKFLVSYPINASSISTKKWDSDNIFLKIQQLVAINTNYIIKW
jgi:uracil-DNA glycosylase